MCCAYAGQESSTMGGRETVYAWHSISTVGTMKSLLCKVCMYWVFMQFRLQGSWLILSTTHVPGSEFALCWSKEILGQCTNRWQHANTRMAMPYMCWAREMWPRTCREDCFQPLGWNKGAWEIPKTKNQTRIWRLLLRLASLFTCRGSWVDFCYLVPVGCSFL